MSVPTPRSRQTTINQHLASLQLPHMPTGLLFGSSSSAAPRSNATRACSSRVSMDNIGPPADAPGTTATSTATNTATGAAATTTTGTTTATSTNYSPPTIRILIVSDIDLESACRLAEAALESSSSQSSSPNPLHQVDLCIACGPFCRDDDLYPYLRGRQRRRRGGQYDRLAPFSSQVAPSSRAVEPSATTSTTKTRRIDQQHDPYYHARTLEETASLEGLMTASLSQLESIVCRVLYIPGPTDPLSTLTTRAAATTTSNTTHYQDGNDDYSDIPIATRSLSSSARKNHNHNHTYGNKIVTYTNERRLTPNSRNIHQHWIPLCHGLGCAGLLYLQESPPSLRLLQHQQQDHHPQLHHPYPAYSDSDDDESSSSLDSSCHDDEQDDDDDSTMDAVVSHNDVNNNNLFVTRPTSPDGSITTGMPPLVNNRRESITSHVGVTGDYDLGSSGSQHQPLFLRQQEQAYEKLFREQLDGLVELAPPLAAMMAKGMTTTTTSRDNDDDHDNLSDDHNQDAPDGVPVPLRDRCQSILVTHFCLPNYPLGTMRNTSPKTTNDKNETDDGVPYPLSFFPQSHEEWLESPNTQRDVLLEIAIVDSPTTSSNGNSSRNNNRETDTGSCGPTQLTRGKVHMILPGSLKQDGSYCVVDVAYECDHAGDLNIVEDANADLESDVRSFRWRVQQSTFYTLDDYDEWS